MTRKQKRRQWLAAALIGAATLARPSSAAWVSSIEGTSTVSPVTDAIVSGTIEATLDLPATSASGSALQAWITEAAPQFSAAFRNDTEALTGASIRSVCKDIVACLVADVTVVPCYAYLEKHEGSAFSEGYLVDFSLVPISSASASSATSASPQPAPRVTRYLDENALFVAVKQLYAVCATKTVTIVGAGAEAQSALLDAPSAAGVDGSTRRLLQSLPPAAPSSSGSLVLSIGSTATMQSPSPDLNTAVVGLVMTHVVGEVNAAAASGSTALLQGALPSTKALYDGMFASTAGGGELKGDNVTIAAVDVEVAQDYSPSIPPTRRPAFPSNGNNSQKLSPGGVAAIAISSLVIVVVGSAFVMALRSRRLRQLSAGFPPGSATATASRRAGGPFTSLDHRLDHRLDEDHDGASSAIQTSTTSSSGGYSGGIATTSARGPGDEKSGSSAKKAAAAPLIQK